ncbi:MAG TPA: sulfatase [Tepidisphaeraceae bacterium]|nr:sulfatase [Tepidisphaeraceae bacterium]
MKRSAILSLASAALSLCGRACPRAEAAKPTTENRRPNILFIYTDDQRWDAMSCVQKEMGDKARFPWFKTPNMDRLAAEGVRFRNAFVVNSLCSPSRSTFLTGLYSHLDGVATNHAPMPETVLNSAKVLDAAGYATAYIGKFHHGKQMDRPGFQYVASFIGQGQYIDCPINVNGKMTPSHGWVDDVSTDYAINFIKNQTKNHPDQPFDMVIGFKSPHDPHVPPPRAAHRFADQEYGPVPNLHIPPVYPLDDRQGDSHWGGGNRWLLQLYQLNYFRCISAADDDLGRVLDTLDRLHIANNTVVIYTTDNGYYLGEHELYDKRTAYDESLRIPMLIRYPGHVPAGKVMNQMVLNIDVPETIIDFAGVQVPPSMQGMSWVPLFTEKHPKWRDSFFYEYFQESYFKSPTTLAVRTENDILIKYPGYPQWTELFDLKKDPYELHNLVHNPKDAKLLGQMDAKFVQQAKEVKYCVPSYADPTPLLQ